MNSVARLKDQARKHEQKEDWLGAIEVYLDVLRLSEESDGEAELTLFNRIGDLYLRLGKSADAVSYYEQAADRYAQDGFFNNAIALCNKGLRYQPQRAELYRRLGRFSAQQGFVADAQRWFLDYAERMVRAGETKPAVAALEECADLLGDADSRELLGGFLARHDEPARAVEHLSLAYELRLRAREEEAAEALKQQILEMDPAVELAGPEIVGLKAPAPKRSRWEEAKPLPGFEPTAVVDKSSSSQAPADTAQPLELIEPPAPSEPEDVAEPLEEIEPVEPVEPGVEIEGVEAVEPVEQEEWADTAQPLELIEPPAPSEPEDVAEPEAVEPGVEIEGVEPGDELEPEPTAALPEEEVGEVDRFVASEVVDESEAEADAGEQTGADVAAAEDWILELDAAVVGSDELEPGDAAPVGLAEAGAEDEIPDEEVVDAGSATGLSLEQELEELVRTEAAKQRETPDFGAEAVAEAEPVAAEAMEPGAEGVEAVSELEPEAEEEAWPEAGSGMESGEQALDVLDEEEWEEDVGADLPLLADWEAHREAEELRAEELSARAGELVRALDLFRAGDELGAAATVEDVYQGLMRADLQEEAREVLEEFARWLPERIQTHQLRVEHAMQVGEREMLIEAYLDLAGCLARNGATTKARVVFEQVLEVDPDNPQAQAALALSRPARPEEDEEYVDLAALIGDDEPAEPESTRFMVVGRTPTGDDERDFIDALAEFRAKVDQFVDVDDTASHYDLGLAFKEMGLIDEAIAEFQTVLRGGDESLKVYEELGKCFMLKGQYNIGMKVLQRALKLPASVELERLGVYYNLGRCYEELGLRGEARDAYERVVGVDVHFLDVSERLARL